MTLATATSENVPFSVLDLVLTGPGTTTAAALHDATAVARAAADRPDLILMDISIPGMDGIRATEELKRDPRTVGIPVVIITAHPYGSVGKRAVDAGCDGYLTKPCDPRRVLQEVRHRLGDVPN